MLIFVLILLPSYTQEEEDILCALFFIGKNHGKFSAKRVKEFKLEIKPAYAGELSLDCPQVAVLLVLAVSSSFSDEQCTRDLPATIFAQTVPLFNKISHSLGGGMDSDLLLTYLFHHSEMAFPANSIKSKEVELLPHIVEEVISNYKKRTDLICSFSWPVSIEISESSLKENLSGLSEASAYLEHSKQVRECLAEEKTQSIKLILKSVKEIWPLMQSHCTYKVRRMLRTCKEELEMIAWSADEKFTAILAFASYYVLVMQLFAELWEKLQIRKFHVGTISVDLLFEKLESCLKRMKYGFPGLCREEECHILELNLLIYVLRIFTVGICSDPMLHKLLAVVSRLELLSGERSSELSSFSKELKNACTEGRMRKSPQLFDVHKLIPLFLLEQLPLCGRFRFINAELCSIGHNTETPLHFIPELPIGIMFQITLYNVSNKDRLWLRMAVGRSSQYVFLDLCLFEGSDEVRKCTVNLPFYATPKATFFQLKASVCMECLPEDFMLCRKVSRGPQHEVMQLSEEYDIYLIRMENK